MGPQRILIVSDEALDQNVRGALEERGFTVTDDIDGIKLIKRVRATPTLKSSLILVVAEWGIGAATLALSQGADAYEPQPLGGTRLLDSVERLLSRQAVVIK